MCVLPFQKLTNKIEMQGGRYEMNQQEKRIYLIHELLHEDPSYKDFAIPDNELEQRQLLRSLMNVRMPKYISKAFLEIQDEYLQEELKEKGITKLSDLTPIQEGIYLWQGDITTLECDAIVNAANSKLLGCFYPCHGCIDNAIHTYAGIELRQTCARIMQVQGHDEYTGQAKITPAYNLPSKYILHTVGPIIYGSVLKEDRELLASCYCSCLELAEKNDIQSIAFCCISTGEFHFPNKDAAKIAIETVKKFKHETSSKMEVIFNVFKQQDYDIYRKFLNRY